MRRVWDVFHVLLGRTYLSGLPTKNLKTFFKNLGFSALVIVYKNVRYTAIVMPAMPSLHGMQYKNSSGDEIANVNFFTTISHTYFKIPKKRTYFV